MTFASIEPRNLFCTNMFRYNNGFDDGPIVDALIFSIKPKDTAETILYRNVIAMCNIIEKSLHNLISDAVKYYPQKLTSNEIFYPKRQPGDGIIDWSNSVGNFDRLRRVVGRPFHGEVAYNDRDKISVYRVSIF